MNYLISCIGTNSILEFSESKLKIICRKKIPLFNEYDSFHSVRLWKNGYLGSTRSTLFYLDKELNIHKIWSHPRFCNVHVAEPLSNNTIAICNTGYDEILFCRLTQDIDIEGRFDISKYLGRKKNVTISDRRYKPKLSSLYDLSHANSCTPYYINGQTVLLIALYHQGCVIGVCPYTYEVIFCIEDVGLGIHSPVYNTQSGVLTVCSSMESRIYCYDFESMKLLFSWEAQDIVWTHSPIFINQNEILFCAEGDRNLGTQSFIAKVRYPSGETIWCYPLLKDRPFDIIPKMNKE